MGNFTSCCSSASVIELQTAKLIDFNGSVRRIKVPITAAELMLEQPSHFISPAEDLRRTLRYSAAMKAEEELSAGKLYVLVPTSRLHSKASVAEMAVLESAYHRKRPNRRSAKVLPAATEVVCGEEEERAGGLGLRGENDTVVPGCRLGVNYNRQWRPALEPIREGI